MIGGVNIRMLSLELFSKAARGDKWAFGQLISLIENNPKEALTLLEKIELAKGNTFTIGIIGGPGTGKSTLINSLLSLISKGGESIAILTVDPTSPFTGGAVLGDRLRMQTYANLPNVFVRSMGTRGHQGGLSACAAEVIEILCALKFDVVIIETAGAGQVDLGIADVADTIIVVLVPGWGDSIQVAKAGLMEIADIYVVNKCDQDGAMAAVRDIELMLDYRQMLERKPKVLQTSATAGIGISELWKEINAHQSYLSSTGKGFERRVRRMAAIIKRMVIAQFTSVWDEKKIFSLAGGVIDNRLGISEAMEAMVKVNNQN